MFMSFNARALGLVLDAEIALTVAAKAGFKGIDLLMRDLLTAGHDPKQLKSRMDDLGLRGGAWPLPVSWRGDEAVFARDLEQLPRLAAVAAQLGLFRTGTWVMPETPDRTSPRTAIFDLHVHRLSAIARILATHGSRLGLEVIGVQSFRTGRGEPFITRMKELDPLLAALRTEAPDVGVLVDTFHLYAAEESIEAGLQWGVESVVWVHVAEPPPEASRDRSLIRDTVRGLPAEHGTIPIAAWLKRLSDLGFDGPVTAEPLGGSKALQGLKDADIAATTAAALRSVWPPPATASPAKR